MPPLSTLLPGRMAWNHRLVMAVAALLLVASASSTSLAQSSPGTPAKAWSLEFDGLIFTFDAPASFVVASNQEIEQGGIRTVELIDQSERLDNWSEMISISIVDVSQASSAKDVASDFAESVYELCRVGPTYAYLDSGIIDNVEIEASYIGCGALSDYLGTHGTFSLSLIAVSRQGRALMVEWSANLPPANGPIPINERFVRSRMQFLEPRFSGLKYNS